jgi:hypothetical protein
LELGGKKKREAGIWGDDENSNIDCQADAQHEPRPCAIPHWDTHAMRSFFVASSSFLFSSSHIPMLQLSPKHLVF